MEASKSITVHYGSTPITFRGTCDYHQPHPVSTWSTTLNAGTPVQTVLTVAQRVTGYGGLLGHVTHYAYDGKVDGAVVCTHRTAKSAAWELVRDYVG